MSKSTSDASASQPIDQNPPYAEPSQSLALVKAFTNIRDARLREIIVNMVQRVADPQPQS